MHIPEAAAVSGWGSSLRTGDPAFQSSQCGLLSHHRAEDPYQSQVGLVPSRAGSHLALGAQGSEFQGLLDPTGSVLDTF